MEPLNFDGFTFRREFIDGEHLIIAMKDGIEGKVGVRCLPGEPVPVEKLEVMAVNMWHLHAKLQRSVDKASLKRPKERG